MTTSGAAAPKVVFVVGAPRSGSTVLASALATAPGVVNVGETVQLWKKLTAQRHRCACGRQLRDCDFWCDVMKHGRFDAARVANLSCDDPAYGATMAALYEAVREVAGATTVVDTSKKTRYVDAVIQRLGVEQCIVFHVVRDPRGVLTSGLRGWKQRGSERVPSARMRDTVRMALAWQRANLAALRFRRLGARYRVVRYEDFVADPLSVLAGIGVVTRTGGHTLVVGDNHVAVGNPSRFEHGELDLTLDDAWRRLPRRVRLTSFVAALPLSAWFGYRP